MITRVHHVGIVVSDLDEACGLWRDLLGLPLCRQAEVPDQGVRAALLACGTAEVELLEPTGPDSGVARFLARRGEGLHHLCFESDDVGRDLARLGSWGAELIDARPRQGLAGRIGFLHPRACAGVLVALATPPDHAPLPAAPLSLEAVALAVEDVRGAAHRLRDLFAVPIERADPAWAAAELEIRGVVLRVVAAGGAGRIGIRGLDVTAADLAAATARVRERGLGRPTGATLALDAGETHGAPLIITERRVRA